MIVSFPSKTRAKAHLALVQTAVLQLHETDFEHPDGADRVVEHVEALVADEDRLAGGQQVPVPPAQPRHLDMAMVIPADDVNSIGLNRMLDL